MKKPFLRIIDLYKKMNIEWIPVSVFIAFLFSCWGIAVYEFNCMALPFSYLKGWDKCALGLSYGIICSVLVYILTVCVPLYLRKKRNRQTIYTWLVNTYREFSYVPLKLNDNRDVKYSEEFYIPSEGLQPILDYKCAICILQKANWNQKIKILESNITVFEAVKYYMDSLNERVKLILNVYTDVLNEYEIRCLNAIITNDIYAQLHFLHARQDIIVDGNSDTKKGFNLEESNVDYTIDNLTFICNQISTILANLTCCIRSIYKSYEKKH